MIKVNNIEVSNLSNAIRGMRHPLESYGESDSCGLVNENDYCESSVSWFSLGDKDKELALKLIQAGSDHSKFLRQIFISMDITAPLYWWKEMDQYKISTTTNSTSTMHTIHKKTITTELFSLDTIEPIDIELCNYLENIRQQYLKTKNKKLWRKLIQRLPSSFNQTRTWTGNYQVLRNINSNRKSHKLVEWVEFCSLFKSLPCSEFITSIFTIPFGGSN